MSVIARLWPASKAICSPDRRGGVEALCGMTKSLDLRTSEAA